MTPLHSSPRSGDPHRQVCAQLDAYLALHVAHGDLPDTLFSDSFSGCLDGAETPVRNRQEWSLILRQNLSRKAQGWPLKRPAWRLQDISDAVVVATALLHTQGLPKGDWRATARVLLVLVFRLEGGVWKIVHNSVSHLGQGTPQTQDGALQQLKEQSQALQLRLEERLQTLREKVILYRQLTEDTRDVLWQTDSAMRITYINPADERMRGFKSEEVVGRHVFEMFTDEGIAIVQQKIQARALKEEDNGTEGFSMFEIPHRCKNGGLIWGEVFAKPNRNAQGTITGYHGITRETTERKLLQDQVHELAFYDPLTGLANRRLMLDRLTQTLLSCQRQHSHGALLFLDLDNFKSLNDVHGHVAGDLLLVEVAQRVKACVRSVDTVSRFGGDEFVVMLVALGDGHQEAIAQAGAIAEKIRTRLAKPCRLALTPVHQPHSTVEHHCTASIGMVLFDGHDTNPDTVIEKADAAMYQAKQEGRNRVCFHTLCDQTNGSHLQA